MSDTDATRARQDVVADVDEILEHVINANMLSMPYDVYTELFDAVDGLGVKAEKLQAENAKLRELVRDMWDTMGLLDACAVDEYDEPLNCCTVCDQYGRVDELAGGKRVIGCKLMYRMRELGVD